MDHPIAYKTLPTENINASRICVEPISASLVAVTDDAPAIILALSSVSLSDLNAGLVDASSIISIKDGDWANAILVTMDMSNKAVPSTIEQGQTFQTGDGAFLESVASISPEILELGKITLRLIRDSGVEGEMTEKSKGRWVNSPTNSFTLKIQPRKRNLQFTLYGNPETFEHDDFLRKDQNSYSRGWVENEHDANIFAQLVKESHLRRTK